MEKKQTKAAGAKEFKLNVRYVDFIAKLRQEKIEIGDGNKTKIVTLYNETVGLRPTNVKRVNARNLREEVSTPLKLVLTQKKMTHEEYKEIGNKVVSIIS